MKKVVHGLIAGIVCLGGCQTAALAERQPAMEAALRNLEEAKQNLQNASSDKGGYRAKAMQTIDLAMQQVRAGIEYDNTHNRREERDRQPRRSAF
ncbi:hypothetical protein [Vitreoscilla filiformis]|jgi:NOL1/NOP2/fmu family ribosome biogenesis protein|nr:hypothetical protein [Vitreoscilla filiformis]